MAPRFRASLVKCGTCGRRYTNPASHVCVTRIGRKRGKTKVTPTVALLCPKCGKPYNPLTHVCETRTDFRKRKREHVKATAAAERAAKRAAAGKHEPEDCTDDDCPRYPCKVYKRGYERGCEDTQHAAFNDGYAAGAAASKE